MTVRELLSLMSNLRKAVFLLRPLEANNYFGTHPNTRMRGCQQAGFGSNGPHNLAALRHMAINAMHKEKSKSSLRGKFKLAAWNEGFEKGVGGGGVGAAVVHGRTEGYAGGHLVVEQAACAGAVPCGLPDQ
jgi:hypothetical protein